MHQQTLNTLVDSCFLRLFPLFFLTLAYTHYPPHPRHFGSSTWELSWPELWWGVQGQRGSEGSEGMDLLDQLKSPKKDKDHRGKRNYGSKCEYFPTKKTNIESLPWGCSRSLAWPREWTTRWFRGQSRRGSREPWGDLVGSMFVYFVIHPRYVFVWHSFAYANTSKIQKQKSLQQTPSPLHRNTDIRRHSSNVGDDKLSQSRHGITRVLLGGKDKRGDMSYKY